ncbi:PREDICTED: T-cell immunoglobulin and mucin domain-containing protein 4 [Propithecus coquereli]|uniref:T-cell immunoglobulin and mucin domain-containing protein 4 n=1 Tax=Propithecus coquereli TaxID=379532 RepID=UPI00063F1094|nr:PREDICTED: T-cell immunoglobulin and mucin domain-containing protein 4 [Propithecus coquereli]
MSKGLLVLWLLIEFGRLYLTPAASEIVVTAYLGEPVTLPCLYLSWSQDRNSMCWGKGQCPNSKCNEELIHTDGTMVISRKSSKYQLQGSIRRGDVSLTILNPREGDSGVYCCRIEVPGWFNDVKRNIRLQLERATTTTRRTTTLRTTTTQSEASTSQDARMWKMRDSGTTPQPREFETTSAHNETQVQESVMGTPNFNNLMIIIASSLGFVLLALLLTFLLRGKVMETNCSQKHTRLDNAGECKNVLNDMQHGQEDEDGLFTL